MASSYKMKLGKLTQDEAGILSGTIGGLGLGSVDVVALDVQGMNGKNYLKLIADPSGAAYEIGAAFPKEKDGKPYFSVNLESPLFPAPLNAVLFPDRDDALSFSLMWNRPEQAPKPAAEAKTEATQTQQGQQAQQKGGFFRKNRGITP